jgi:hypothetical protein
MNFDTFARRLKESAAQVAKDAQNFKGFDDMAAKDEYIHSPDGIIPAAAAMKMTNDTHEHVPPHIILNNSNTIAHPEDEDTISAAAADDDTSTLSTHSSVYWVPPGRKQQQPIPRMNSCSSNLPKYANQKDSSFSSSRRHVVPAKVNVPERPHALQERQRHDDDDGFSSSSSSNSDKDEGDDEDDDPILSMIRSTTRQTKASQQRPRSIGGEEQEKSSGASERNALPPRNKPNENKHRFLQDLEDHVARPQQELPTIHTTSTFKASNNHQQQQQPGEENAFLSLLTSPFRMGRTGGATDPLRQHQTGAFLPPLMARPKQQHQQRGSNNTNQDDDDKEVIRLSSAVMLGDEEMEALARLTANKKHPHPGTYYFGLLLQLVQHYPREAFVVFTLLLGMFVYFYSNLQTWDGS